MTTPTTGTQVSKTTLTGTTTTDSLLDGYHWASPALSYSFIGTGSQFDPAYPDPTYIQSTQGFGAAQQAAAQSALSAWASVANLSFSQVADNATSVGTIRFGFSYSHTWGTNVTGATYSPGTVPAGGDVWINPQATDTKIGGFANGTFANSSFALGSNSYATLVHELGHALGLKHPFDSSTDGGGPSLTGTAYASWDSRIVTMMSYTTDPAHPDALGFSYNPTTPMPLDIQAIQAVYGANTTYNSGNTVYSFNDNAGQYYFQTIWDGGGVNTIAYSGGTNSSFDLNQGHGSSVGNAVMEYTAINAAAYQVQNIWIAYGTNIQDLDLSASIANNTVTGNGLGDAILLGSGSNQVTCGAGNDTITCGTGANTIDGGAGTDTVVFQAQQARFSVNKTTSGYTVSDINGAYGTDTLLNVEFLQFSDGTLNLNASTTSTPPATPTRAFLGSGNTLTLADNYVTATGAAGAYAETVRIQSGVIGTKMDANVERVELAGNLASYKFITVAGTGAEVEDSGGTVVATIPSLNQNATIAFADGSAPLAQTGASSFTLGGQTIASGTASGFASSALSGFSATDTSTLGSVSAVGHGTTRVFLGAGNTFTAGDNNVAVTGASGTATDTLRVGAGIIGVHTDANVERIELAGNLSSFKFIAVAGTGAEITDVSGVVIATIPSLNQNATIAFADGSAPLVQTGASSFTLGGQTLANTTAGSFASSALSGFVAADKSSLGNVALGGSVAVAAAGSVSAAGGDFTYQLAAGTYNYAISGFGPGDKIVGFTGAVISIVPNTNTTDGIVSFQFADAVTGKTATVTLTGLTSAQDAAIFNIPSFNAVFGAGALA